MGGIKVSHRREAERPLSQKKLALRYIEMRPESTSHFPDSSSRVAHHVFTSRHKRRRVYIAEVDPFTIDRRTIHIPRHLKSRGKPCISERPINEPPILDWEEFQRTYIASDVRYLALFPNDPEKRARMKDLDGEHENLNEYRQWAKAMSVDSETPQDRVLFYQNLARAIQNDWIAVSKEVDELWSMASDLAQFEFRLLDNEGGTSQIEKSLAEGKDIFRIWGDAARKKYGYVIPSDFTSDPLKTFEDEWLDFDGGTAILERELRAGVDVLASWPDWEVRRKYGDMVRLMPLLPKEDVQVTVAEKESTGIASGADNREGAEEEMLEPDSSKTSVLSTFILSAKRKRYL